MDQAITRAVGATPRAVGEFQGYVDGVDGIKPSVRWLDRKNMPQVGDKLYALPRQAAAPRSWAILLTSANHGTVGPVGSTFSHAGEHHERVQVMEIVEAGAPLAPGVDLPGLVRLELTNEQIAAGAAVHCDCGKPLGRNAAIEVFDAMVGAAPAIANKATEEGELPDCKVYAVIDSMGWDLDDNEKDDMHRLCRQAITADRASRQIANKAEVEPSDSYKSGYADGMEEGARLAFWGNKPSEKFPEGWPAEIWLNAGDDELGPFSEYDEVSWCSAPQGESDIRYIREDLLATAPSPAKESK